jgi:hypothetical protein
MAKVPAIRPPPSNPSSGLQAPRKTSAEILAEVADRLEKRSFAAAVWGKVPGSVRNALNTVGRGVKSKGITAAAGVGGIGTLYAGTTVAGKAKANFQNVRELRAATSPTNVRQEMMRRQMGLGQADANTLPSADL